MKSILVIIFPFFILGFPSWSQTPLGISCVKDDLSLLGKFKKITITQQQDGPQKDLYEVSLQKIERDSHGKLQETFEILISDLPCTFSPTDSKIIKCFKRGDKGLGLHSGTVSYQRVERYFVSGQGSETKDVKSVYIEMYINYPTNKEETKSGDLKDTFRYDSCHVL